MSVGKSIERHITIRAEHEREIAGHVAVLGYLAGEVGRLRVELAAAEKAHAAKSGELGAFVKQHYGVDTAATPATIDVEHGEIRVPETPAPATPPETKQAGS